MRYQAHRWLGVVLIFATSGTFATDESASRSVFGSVANRPLNAELGLHLAREQPLHRELVALFPEHGEDGLAAAGTLVEPEDDRFSVRVSEPGTWWLVASTSVGGLASGEVALPLVGPHSDVVLPPLHAGPGESCRLRLVEPEVAWVAPPGREAVHRGASDSSSRWRPWPRWLRLERGGDDRHYWLERRARASATSVDIRVGALGHRPSRVECSPGELVEVRLVPRTESLLELRLMVDEGGSNEEGDGNGYSARVLREAVVVGSDGWPVGMSDEHGTVAVPRGSFRVLGAEGGEWRIRVDESGTRRLPGPTRRALAFAPISGMQARAVGAAAIHWSRNGDVLMREDVQVTREGSTDGGRSGWVVQPPPGATATTLLVPGFEAAEFDWSHGERDIHLKPLRAVTGLVVAASSGDPVGGAEVALYEAHPGRLGLHATTASNGAFLIETGESRGSQRLTVRSDGYRPLAIDLKPTSSSSTAGELVVRLERVAGLVGRIVSQSDEGLAGAVALVGRRGVLPAPSVGPVGLFLSSNPGLHGFGQADERGVFRFSEVPDTVSAVAVGAPGFATRLLPLRSGTGDAKWTGWRDLGDVVLLPELAIEGVVTDGSGRPLSAAAVGFGRSPDVTGALSLATVAWPTGEIRTDSDGGFRIGGLGDGDLIDLVVTLSGYATAERLRVAVDQAESPVFVQIPLARAVDLGGRVVDESSGEGIEGVSVLLLDAAERRQLALKRTDSEGRFSLSGLASSGGVLKVEAFGYEALRHALRPDDWPHSTDGDGLLLTLRRGRAVVRGIVISSGSPVVGAEVQISTRERATTGSDGRFELTGLPSGRSMVSCWRPGAVTGEPIMWLRDVRPGLNEFVLDLTAVLVEGRVEDTFGQPVAGALVGFTRPFAPSTEARTGPDGAFSFRALPGDYRARAEAEGHVPSLREVNVDSNDPTHVVLSLEATRDLKARVTGLTAQEASIVEVAMETTPLSPAGGARLRKSLDSVAGAPVFVRQNPPRGTVVLIARVPSSDRMRRSVVDVLPTGTTDVEIAFDDPEDSSRLSGVVSVDGAPLAGAPVLVIDESAGDAWAVRTNHRGAYEVDGLQRGTVDVVAVGERRTVRLPDEAWLEFAARSATLAGRVVLADTGVPAGSVEVVAVPEGMPIEAAERTGQTVSALSDETGGFRIDGLFQVPYLIVARRPGGPTLGSAVVDLTTALGEVLVAVRDDAGLE